MFGSHEWKNKQTVKAPTDRKPLSERYCLPGQRLSRHGYRSQFHTMQLYAQWKWRGSLYKTQASFPTR